LAWDKTFLRNFDSNIPHWLENQSISGEGNDWERDSLKDVFEEVDHRDKQRDYSA